MMTAVQYSPAQFPAAVIHTRTSGDFLLTETAYAPNAILATHAHEYACVVVVLEGTFRERFGRRSRVVDAGSVIVRPAGERHSDRLGPAGGRCLNVELPPDWVIQPDRSAAYGGRRVASLGRALCGNDVSPLAIEALIAELFDGQTNERDVPAWLMRVRERLHDDPVSTVTLAQLGAVAGVHPVHLATTFRRFYGATVAAYQRRLRIELACRALEHSDAALAEVALAAGFADQSHFGRAFKRAIGTTPALYRARHNPEP